MVSGGNVAGENMSDGKRVIGPQEKSLILRKAALLAVPPGGGILAAADALKSGKMPGYLREAAEWVAEAIQVLRASNPGPGGKSYADCTDEEIATAIIEAIDAKKRMNEAVKRGYKAQ